MYFLFIFWYPLSLEKILIVYFNKLEFPLPSGTEEDKMWTVCKQTCGRTGDQKSLCELKTVQPSKLSSYLLSPVLPAAVHGKHIYYVPCGMYILRTVHQHHNFISVSHFISCLKLITIGNGRFYRHVWFPFL